MNINFSEEPTATILGADYISLKREGAAFCETLLSVVKLQGFGLKVE
jgi:hypothetical protein